MAYGEKDRNQNETGRKIVTFLKTQKAYGNNNLIGKGVVYSAHSSTLYVTQAYTYTAKIPITHLSTT